MPFKPFRSSVFSFLPGLRAGRPAAARYGSVLRWSAGVFLSLGAAFMPWSAALLLAQATSRSSAAVATSAKVYRSGAGGELVINGTSTLHDWTAKSRTLSGTVALLGRWGGRGGTALRLKSIQLTIPVKSLKSSEGGGMDNTMYHALHRQQHPLITYRLEKATVKKSPVSKVGSYVFSAKGVLTVNGTAKTIHLDIYLSRRPTGGLNITTKAKLKMTDFTVNPPTAMFGIIRSGNAITVTATWHLTRKPGT